MQSAIFAKLDGQLALGIYLCLPSNGEVTGRHRQVCLCVSGWWGIELSSSCLCMEDSHSLSHLLSCRFLCLCNRKHQRLFSPNSDTSSISADSLQALLRDEKM